MGDGWGLVFRSDNQCNTPIIHFIKERLCESLKSFSGQKTVKNAMSKKTKAIDELKQWLPNLMDVKDFKEADSKFPPLVLLIFHHQANIEIEIFCDDMKNKIQGNKYFGTRALEDLDWCVDC